MSLPVPGGGKKKKNTDDYSIEDAKKAIRNLKNNKAESIQYGGNKLPNRMYELVGQIWEEERIPEEWKQTIIVPAAHKILSNFNIGKN